MPVIAHLLRRGGGGGGDCLQISCFWLKQQSLTQAANRVRKWEKQQIQTLKRLKLVEIRNRHPPCQSIWIKSSPWGQKVIKSQLVFQYSSGEERWTILNQSLNGDKRHGNLFALGHLSLFCGEHTKKKKQAKCKTIFESWSCSTSRWQTWKRLTTVVKVQGGGHWIGGWDGVAGERERDYPQTFSLREPERMGEDVPCVLVNPS